MRILWGILFAFVVAVGLSAQTAEVKSKTKIKIKDGKDVTFVGCVEASPGPGGYALTEVTGNDAHAEVYQLIGEDDDGDDELARFVGHRVEVRGEAVDKEHGKIEVETQTEHRNAGARDRKTESDREFEGPRDMAFLGVKSIRIVPGRCGRG